MAKPTRIKHSGLGLFLNDKQIDRVQTCGSTSTLNTEDLSEIGNENIVEVLDSAPTVDITIDTNQYGSIKTMAQLANKNFDYGYPQIVPNSGLTVNVTSGSYYINEMKYDTLIDQNNIDLAPTPPLETGEAQIDVLSVDTDGNITVTEGTPFTYSNASEWADARPDTPEGDLKLGEVYLVNGVSEITSDYIANFHDPLEVDLMDFEYAKVDVVSPVKEVGNNLTDDPVTRTMYIENAFCNRIDMAFNSDGLSTENFTCESDNKRWFVNTARSVFVDRFVGTAFGSTGPFTLTHTPTQMDNLNYALKVRVFDSTDGTYKVLEEVASDPDENQYAISGDSITLGDEINDTQTLIVRYCSDDDQPVSFEMLPNPKDPHPDPAGGVRQGNCEIYIVGPSPDTFEINPKGEDYSPTRSLGQSADFVLRVESCTITADLTREALNEVGHALPYDRPLTIPVNVTISLNTKSSDLQEFARYIGRYAEWEAKTLKEMSIDRLSKDLALKVYVFRETDVKRKDIPFAFAPWLKKVELSNVAVTEEAFEGSVGNNATQNFNFKADNLKVTARV